MVPESASGDVLIGVVFCAVPLQVPEKSIGDFLSLSHLMVHLHMHRPELHKDFRVRHLKTLQRHAKNGDHERVWARLKAVTEWGTGIAYT
jgi:hypothetical protein